MRSVDSKARGEQSSRLHSSLSHRRRERKSTHSYRQKPLSLMPFVPTRSCAGNSCKLISPTKGRGLGVNGPSFEPADGTAREFPFNREQCWEFATHGPN